MIHSDDKVPGKIRFRNHTTSRYFRISLSPTLVWKQSRIYLHSRNTQLFSHNYTRVNSTLTLTGAALTLIKLDIFRRYINSTLANSQRRMGLQLSTLTNPQLQAISQSHAHAQLT